MSERERDIEKEGERNALERCVNVILFPLVHQCLSYEIN